MNKFTQEAKIGLAGIAAIAILFFGIKFLKGIDLFKATNYYYVEFGNVGGLTQSSPVYADGYHIGIVRDIAYDYRRPGHVVVEIEVDREFRMPCGSEGELVTEMLGTTKMNLLLDKEARTWYAPGDTLPGHVNGGLVDEAARIVPAMSRMLPRLDSILASLNTLLADPALAATLHHAEHLTANLETTTSRLSRFMDDDLPRLTGNLHTITDNFAAVSGQLRELPYASTFQRLDTTLHNVELFTGRLNRRDNSLGLLLNDTCLYGNLNRTTAGAAALLEDLKARPKRYVHFSLFGKKNE